MQKATNKKKIKKCVLCIYFNLEVHKIEREARSEIAKTLNQRISRISADKVANKQMRELGSSATTIKVRERESGDIPELGEPMEMLGLPIVGGVEAIFL